MKRIKFWLGVGLALILNIVVWQPLWAAGPEGERRVAFGSTHIACRVIEGGAAESVQLTVDLGTWEGEVEAADLELVIGGTQAEHSIYVNGRRLAGTAVRPQEYVCGSEPDWFSTDSLAIPPEWLNQGENTITLTNDGNVDDGWTAANVQIIIHGTLRKLVPAGGVSAPPPPSATGISAQDVVTGPFTVTIPSTYELALGNNISQTVAYQIPDNYNSITTDLPLVIVIHGMGGDAEGARDYFAAEANSRDWLLAAPHMHGAYYQTGSGTSKSLAWIGAQHDIIDTINYMIEHWEVDTSKIYLIGGSMGGQTTTMTAAKYPDIFAAAVAWKPLTDLEIWYDYLMDNEEPYNIPRDIRRETGAASNAGQTGTMPDQARFEYQRRSPMEVPQNDSLLPLTMWHAENDDLVPIYHSQDLRDALNGWRAPAYTVVLTEVASADNQCPTDPYDHCYTPPTSEVADFLDGKSRSSSPPSALNIRTEESKSYFWLNLAQTGQDHWSEVAAGYSDQTVSATISDTQPLTVAFNLGSAPITDVVGIGQAGMGLPVTTYLIREDGVGSLDTYSSGYFTTTLSTTGRFSLTISSITVTVSANPLTILADGVATTTLTIEARDQLNNPVPDGEEVAISTTRGTFPGGTTDTVILTGGTGEIVLTAAASAGQADIAATLESVSGSTFVDIVEPQAYLPIILR